MQATETLCHLSITDIKKTFCNVWFFCKNEACANCTGWNATTVIWLLGVCWEDSGSPLLIILQFGGLFNHKFCKFLCLVRYERNLWKRNTYLVYKIKKSCTLWQGQGGLMGMTPAFHPRVPGSIPWVGEDFFKLFFIPSYIFLLI